MEMDSEDEAEEFGEEVDKVTEEVIDISAELAEFCDETELAQAIDYMMEMFEGKRSHAELVCDDKRIILEKNRFGIRVEFQDLL